MNTPNPKRPVLAKILASVAVLTLAVGVFAIPCSANMSTLSPREQITSVIPLDSLYFPDNSYGVNSVMSSPCTYFGVNSGTYTDIQRFPVGISSSGTSVTTLNSFQFRHNVSGSYTDEVRIVNTSTYDSENWSNLLSSNGNGFNHIVLRYQPFVNLPNTCEVNFTFNNRDGNTIIVNAGMRITYSYTVYADGAPRDVSGVYYRPLLLEGETYSLDFPIGDVLPTPAGNFITNLELDFQLGNSSGVTRTELGEPVIGFRNECISTTAYAERMSDIPVFYKQVINTRTYSDLLDFLGDAMENFLTTELFPIGNLSVTPMAIIGVILGLAITLLCLKFFAGG